MQDQNGQVEENEQCQRIYNGGDKRAGHDGRVKADFLSQDRQHTSDDLCNYDGKEQSDRNGDHDQDANFILEDQHFQEIDNCQRQTADDAYPEFFPQCPENIFEMNFIQ